MTVLFSSDLESYAGGGAAVTGWTTAVGAGLQTFVASTSSANHAVSGIIAFGRTSDGDQANYTASGTLGDQAIRTDCKDVVVTSGALRQIHHCLRFNSSGLNGYYLFLETDGTAIRARISRYQSGSTTLVSSSYTLVAVATDVVHMESRAVGSALEIRVWLNSGARPATTTATATEICLTTTDSTFTTGYPGLRKLGPSSTFCLTDNIVVTDAAGGENTFDGASSSLTWTEANDVTAIIANSGIGTSGSLAWTEANDTTSGAITVGSGGPLAWTEANDTTAITVSEAVPKLVTDPMHNNTTAALQASLSGFTVEVLKHSDMTAVKNFTAQTTDSSGVMTIMDSIFVVGTVYVVVIRNTAGEIACEKYTAV